jgi:hypothetical protein
MSVGIAKKTERQRLRLRRAEARALYATELEDSKRRRDQKRRTHARRRYAGRTKKGKTRCRNGIYSVMDSVMAAKFETELKRHLATLEGPAATVMRGSVFHAFPDGSLDPDGLADVVHVNLPLVQKTDPLVSFLQVLCTKLDVLSGLRERGMPEHLL